MPGHAGSSVATRSAVAVGDWAGKDEGSSRTPAAINWVVCVGGGRMPSPGWNRSGVDPRCGPGWSGSPGPGLAAGSPTSASRRGAARESGVLGGPAPDRGNSSCTEAPSRGWGVGSELQVVVGLGEVTVLDSRGLVIFLTVHQKAAASVREIHIAGAEHDAVRRAPRVTGLDEFLTLDSTADAVIAGFRAAPGAAADPTGRIWMGCPVTQVGVSIQDITGGAAVQPYTRNRVVEVRHEHRHRH